MAQHPVDVLHHVARPRAQMVLAHQGLARIGIEGIERLLAQRIEPFLYGVMLLITQIFQRVQLAARVHQRVPVRKPRVGIEQFGLPDLDLRTQFPADFQVAIDHFVDHAQRQVRRTRRQAAARRVDVAALLGIFEQAPDDGISSPATFGMHADEQPVVHGKPRGQ